MQKFNLKLMTPIIVISSYSILATDQIQEQKQNIEKCTQIFKSIQYVLDTLNKALLDFFSQKNLNTIANHAEKHKKMRAHFKTMILKMQEEAHGHEGLIELISYAEGFMQQFDLFIGIVDEYKDKPASHAVSFAQKLKSKIDIKKIFVDIVTKLKKLETKYATLDKLFAAHLSECIAKLKSIASSWEGKKEAHMLDDIIVRMTRKAQ